MTPDERPDPLAEPEGYGRKPQDEAGPDLSICSQIILLTSFPPKSDHCPEPASIVIWIGCTQGEHAGPAAFCQKHWEDAVSRVVFLVCGQCLDKKVHPWGRAQIMKVTDLDGNEIPRQPAAVDKLLSGVFNPAGGDTFA